MAHLEVRSGSIQSAFSFVVLASGWRSRARTAEIHGPATGPPHTTHFRPRSFGRVRGVQALRHTGGGDLEEGPRGARGAGGLATKSPGWSRTSKEHRRKIHGKIDQARRAQYGSKLNAHSRAFVATASASQPFVGHQGLDWPLSLRIEHEGDRFLEHFNVICQAKKCIELQTRRRTVNVCVARRHHEQELDLTSQIAASRSPPGQRFAACFGSCAIFRILLQARAAD